MVATSCLRPDRTNLSPDDPDVRDRRLRPRPAGEHDHARQPCLRPGWSEGVPPTAVTPVDLRRRALRRLRHEGASQTLTTQTPCRTSTCATCRPIRPRSADRAPGLAGAKANARAEEPDISGDGRYVTFGTNATNLSPDDTVFPSWDMYVRDMQTGAVTLASRADGPTGVSGNTNGNKGATPRISADGRIVAFSHRDQPQSQTTPTRVPTSTCATWTRTRPCSQAVPRSCGAKGGPILLIRRSPAMAAMSAFIRRPTT